MVCALCKDVVDAMVPVLSLSQFQASSKCHFIAHSYTKSVSPLTINMFLKKTRHVLKNPV